MDVFEAVLVSEALISNFNLDLNFTFQLIWPSY